MILNKDVGFDPNKQELTINGETYKVTGDPAPLNALAVVVGRNSQAITDLHAGEEALEANYQRASERITALEQQGGGINVINWDYTSEPTLLPFGKRRLLIARNVFTEEGSPCGIVYFDDNNKVIFQDSNFNIGIEKRANGWELLKIAGTAGFCSIFEF